MIEIAQDVIVDLSINYMITESEFNESIESRIADRITPKWLEEMYQCGDFLSRKEFSYREIDPFFEDVIRNREVITLPQKRKIEKAIRKNYRFLVYEYIILRIRALFGNKEAIMLTEKSCT